MKNNINFPPQDLRKTILKVGREKNCYRYETQTIKCWDPSQKTLVCVCVCGGEDSPKILKARFCVRIVG